MKSFFEYNGVVKYANELSFIDSYIVSYIPIKVSDLKELKALYYNVDIDFVSIYLNEQIYSNIESFYSDLKNAFKRNLIETEYNYIHNYLSNYLNMLLFWFSKF